MSDSVHQRNIRALAEAAKSADERHSQLHMRVRQLEVQVAMLRAAVSDIGQSVNVLRALSAGNGPTSRSTT